MRQRALEYNRDYGIDKRSGWSVVIDGRVVLQFVPLWRALLSFVFGWTIRQRNGSWHTSGRANADTGLHD